jgi:hypothetical protein
MRTYTIDTVYDLYLGKSDLEVIRLKPGSSPAAIYNEVLDSETGLIGFIHSDVTCCGLEQAILRTIATHGFDGAMGVVGNGSRWAIKGDSFMASTCDSCFILVDADRPERFDDINFDGFHLYVEDYCCQVGGVRIIDINGYEQREPEGCDYFTHWSHTLRQQGCSWGDYGKYKQILNKKWNRAVPTT